MVVPETCSNSLIRIGQLMERASSLHGSPNIPLQPETIIRDVSANCGAKAKLTVP